MAKKGKTYLADIEFTDAEVLEKFGFPSIFILQDDSGKIIKQIAYDSTGNKSVTTFGGLEDRVIQIGPVTATTTTIDLALFSSGENKFLKDGQILSKNTADHWDFAEVTSEKVFTIYVVNDPAIVHLALDGEEVPEGALIVAIITISENGISINDNKFKLKQESNWQNLEIKSNATPIILDQPSDVRGSFYLTKSLGVGEITIEGIKRLSSGTVAKDYMYGGREMLLFNATGGNIIIDSSGATDPDSYFFSDRITPFTLKNDSSILVKLRGDVIELLPSGSDPDLSPYALLTDLAAEAATRLANDNAEIVNRAAADLVLQNQVTTEQNKTASVADKMLHYWDSTLGRWFSSGVEFLGNAILKLKIISFGGYTIAQKNAIASPTEGMLIYQNESPKGFQKYEGGVWSAIGSNISNADLSNVSARIFTQGNSFTWNTAGFGYFWKGLADKTGNATYSKSLIIHPTTGETVTRDFADPAATTLAVQNANTTQKTAMRTALLGTATPANPVLQDASSRFIQPGINVIDLIGLNLTLLVPTFLWIEKDDLTKIFATNFYNVSGTVVTSVWTIPADLPNGDYPIKIQNGVTVQGLSNAVFTKVDAITPLTISGAGWLRKVRKLDDGVTDSNDYNPDSNQAVDDYMTISAVGIAGNNQPGIIAKTDNIILGSKDYDFEIKFQSNGSTGGSVGWNPFIGLTETTNANFTTVNDIVRNVVVNEVDLTQGRINSGTSAMGLGGNPGQMWWVYFAKVRNKVYIRMYNKNTLSNFTYWSYDIDITKNYALFVANSSTTATHQPIRMLWINARIMN